MPASPSPRAAPALAVRPAGERALLLETAGTTEAAALHRTLSAVPLPGQVEAVPAARTVLLRFATAAQARQAAGPAALLEPGNGQERGADTPLVELPTIYDGEDLDDVARLTGLGSAQAVVQAHAAALWTAAFCGFAPGFAYLTGGGRQLEVPRREEPRTTVPAGAVALAGEYSAAYPGVSPGGWQLIGRTSAALWDLEREFPALISPGTRVRFVPVRERVQVSEPAAQQTPRAGAHATGTGTGTEPVFRPAATVLAAGPLATVQDLGRPALSHIGVSRSGAADRSALLRANRLTGNPPGAAGLEVLFGGLHLRAEQDLVLAVTGAAAPLRIVLPDGAERTAGVDRAFVLRAGCHLALGAPAAGLRSYVGFRGGLQATPVLGSRSTDTLAGLGPRPLRPGDLLGVGGDPGTAVGHPETPPPLPGEATTELRYIPGPRQDWFGAEGTSAFESRTWTVGERSNRVGIRFEGEALTDRETGELASEAVLPGSVQVPPSGLPILFLADAPVTGGYPVIGVVVEADLDTAAQLRPGSAVRFIPTAPAG
ncbi:5-oxoprolinase/urea amidolyase family protein [Arthrobacter gandavensis]|uniref:5-oxoprolinase subunit B/C family protein n=1 Tax=Arthrobacter gandavensis TaxID=169960 RepID=UPI00188F75A5|nr:5-oxoprolinase/urea amidolyase family protein [Arthrobacter gandavensis]MBF4994282.1 5-oxoprolinase/urea amidolyase family protein [Arthrobacter gandavensis]